MARHNNPGMVGSHAGCLGVYDAQNDRDRPLTLRLDGKKYKKDFQEALGCRLTDTCIAIICDLCASGLQTSYSRHAGFYDQPRRYDNGLFHYRKVVGAMDKLDSLGLIDHDKREPGQRGRQSTATATAKLLAIYRDVVGDSTPKLLLPNEPIILRDPQKRAIDYRDTNNTIAMRRSLERFNRSLCLADIHGTEKGPLRRVFNGKFNSGDRALVLGKSWQNMKSNNRKKITINGEGVAELDYKNLHPRLLYAWVHKPAPEDCYSISGYPRSLVKKALLILPNASSELGAIQAFSKCEEVQKLAFECSMDGKEVFNFCKDIVSELKALHSPIERYFFRGMGNQLMRLDSDMARFVMDALLEQDILALPVHDSFIVAKFKVVFLENAMEEAALKKIGVYIPIEAKY